MERCTGRNCIMQYDKVDPATYQAVTYCPQATPPKSNADKIRAMTDEELAVWLHSIRYSWTCIPRDNGNRCTDFKDDCEACWLNWLKQGTDG